MATRNEVLTLFGATPEQIRDKQMREQAATLQQIRDPYQQTGTAIGMALGRAFSGPTNEEQMAQQMQTALQGIDPNDPQQLREVAQTVASFDPNRALQISNYAMQLEKSQMSSIVNVPAIVGYETEPDIDVTTGLQRLDENNQPLFKRTPIFRNVPFERTRDGLKSLVPGYSLPSGASTAVKTDDAVEKSQDPIPDYITNEQGVVVPNPAKTAGGTATTPSQTVTSNVSPEAADRMTMQSGASRTARTGETGVGIVPPATIQGEVTYANPEVLGEEINVLQAKLDAMPRTAKGRKDLQKQIAKLRQQQRKFSSSSSGGQNRRNK